MQRIQKKPVRFVLLLALLLGLAGMEVFGAQTGGQEALQTQGSETGSSPAAVSARSYVGGIIEEQLMQLDIGQLESMMPRDAGGKPALDLSVRGIIDNVMDGKPMIDIYEIMDAVIGFFTGEIKDNLRFATEILVVCVIIGLLKNMSGSIGEPAVSQVAMLICGCTVMGICLRSFLDIYKACIESVQTMVDIMQSLLPIMITLMISSGSLTGGAVLNPVILAAVNVFITVITGLILPGLFTASVFFLINGLTEKDYIKKLAKFIRTVSLFVMGFCITIFSGIVALQGIVSSSADSLLLKGVKFSADKFIPIIGGFVSDSLSLIMSCAGLIKSVAGVFGAVLITVSILIPMLKIIVIALIYKVTAMIIEPLGEQKISDSIDEIGNTAITLAMILGLAAFLFLIFIAILLNIGRV